MSQWDHIHSPPTLNFTPDAPFIQSTPPVYPFTFNTPSDFLNLDESSSSFSEFLPETLMVDSNQEELASGGNFIDVSSTRNLEVESSTIDPTVYEAETPAKLVVDESSTAELVSKFEVELSTTDLVVDEVETLGKVGSRCWSDGMSPTMIMMFEIYFPRVPMHP